MSDSTQASNAPSPSPQDTAPGSSRKRVLLFSILALAIAAGLPGFVRALALVRCRASCLETQGAANDARY